MKLLVLIIIVFFSFNVFSESNDSPNFNFKKTDQTNWSDWINILKKELKKEGFKDSTITLLNDITFNPRVVELDRKQPEFKLSFQEYLSRNINKKRKVLLNKKFNENKDLLSQISEEFGVDSKILVSLWGIETSFGKILGKFNILRSLASLAYDGRRKDFFLKELRFALKILDDGHIEVSQFKGSWAGAFGQTQFMPSTFKKFAINFDNDKKINLFMKSDALASGANYLSQVGWEKNLFWGERVKIDLNNKLKDLSKKKVYKNQKFWEKIGIFPKNKYNDNVLLRLVIPDLGDDQFFLVTKNFDVILDWNRSNYFALTVFLLSNEIKN